MFITEIKQNATKKSEILFPKISDFTKSSITNMQPIQMLKQIGYYFSIFKNYKIILLYCPIDLHLRKDLLN